MFNDGYEALCHYIVDDPHTMDVAADVVCDCAELLGIVADEAKIGVKPKQ